MTAHSAPSADSYASRARALVVAGHPGPALVITAFVTALAAQAAPHGIGPVLTAPALLAGQLSIGWSNDACDAARDPTAGRTDKPVARGDISVGAVWIAAFSALAVVAICRWPSARGGAVTPSWLVPLGVQPRPQVDLGVGRDVPAGIRPAARVRGEHAARSPGPRWPVMAARVLGLGAHFANVLPDLAADRSAGVRGLPQRVAARWGPAAVRAVALVLLLAASVLLLLAASRPAGGSPCPAWWPPCCSPWSDSAVRKDTVLRGDRHRCRRRRAIPPGSEALT